MSEGPGRIEISPVSHGLRVRSLRAESYCLDERAIICGIAHDREGGARWTVCPGALDKLATAKGLWGLSLIDVGHDGGGWRSGTDAWFSGRVCKPDSRCRYVSGGEGGVGDGDVAGG